VDVAVAEETFAISVDEAAWEKWGFQYPVTYVFRLGGVGEEARVLRRDRPDAPWSPLEEKTRADFFNGVECVRFAPDGSKAYVSVGFGESNTVYVKLTNCESAAFDSIATYYDDRKAAYTLSDDNWGRRLSANPGAEWRGMSDDASDHYQASIHACRMHGIPVSIGINSRVPGTEGMWTRMQEELDRGDRSWEPVVHSSTHPCSQAAYAVHGYEFEIVGCRDDLLRRLAHIPYGQRVYEFILPCGYQDDQLERASQGKFLFLRDWNTTDNPASTEYLPWNAARAYYGRGGYQTKSYDTVLESREPKGRYYAADVAALDDAFDRVYEHGRIFYAMWHSDRYRNSVIHDPRPGVDGVEGSTLMQHFTHVSKRPDVWYVANGWLYSYRYVAENARVR
ncbi:MAG: hypothetical protein HQ582_31680, partial [Planctomycetes bacterium]|nr:hypothetical protein [Planctomycetota bacterium]